MDFSGIVQALLFSEMRIPGLNIRIATALVGLVVLCFYDLWNNKNVPDEVVYGFMIVAIVENMLFYAPFTTLFAFISSFIIFVILYILYIGGFLGGADVYAFAAIALLIPKDVQLQHINVPYVFTLVIASGILFSLYFLVNVLIRYVGRRKGNYLYLLMLIPYGMVLYYIWSMTFIPTTYILGMALLVVASTFYLVYKHEILKDMAKKVSLDEVDEEEVVAVELLPPEEAKHMPRVLTSEEIEKLKKQGVKEVLIYSGLPPFVPFMLVGFILTIFFKFPPFV